LATQGFKATSIRCDPEKGFEPLVGAITDVPVIVAGAGSHEETAERRIQTVKERMRAIEAGLPYRLPKKVFPYLAFYVAVHLNTLPCSWRVDNASPRELFTGVKVNAESELQLGFGDYVQAFDKTRDRHGPDPRTD